MPTPKGHWQVTGTAEVFERCKKDERFPYIVALSRAVNSLNFVHSAMLCAGQEPTPDARRARLNSYFFASALLYEGIRLIRAMNQPFKTDDLYRKGLHGICGTPWRSGSNGSISITRETARYFISCRSISRA